MKSSCLFAILLSSCSNSRPDYREANWPAPQKSKIEQVGVLASKPVTPTAAAPAAIPSKPVYVGNGNSDWEAERDAEMSDMRTRMLDAEERLSEMENE